MKLVITILFVLPATIALLVLGLALRMPVQFISKRFA